MSISIHRFDNRHQFLDRGRIWLYAIDERVSVVVGTLSIDRPKEITSAWLNDLFVEPGSRKRGIGRRLIEAAYSLCSHDSLLKHVTCGIDPKNESSQRLFAAAGWRHVYTWDSGVLLFSREIERRASA